MKMKATLSDIAKKTGLHKSSISLVLGDKPLAKRFSKQTRDKIIRAAQELNYRPSFVARALSKGKTATLGLICGDINTPHFAELAAVALDVAEKEEQQLLVSVTKWNPDRELECIEMLIQRGVDGIMVYSGALQPNTMLYKNIMDQKFPIVTLEHKIPGLPCVRTDFAEGMRQVAELLYKAGHTSLGYVSQLSPNMGPRTKLRALQKACKKYGIEVIVYECDLGMPAAKMLGVNIAKLSTRPGAFMVFSDFAAVGFISGLRSAGLDIPRDLDIISVNATQWSEYQHPPLTSISRDRKNLITHAINLLINYEKKTSESIPEIMCQSSLVIRESVKF